MFRKNLPQLVFGVLLMVVLAHCERIDAAPQNELPPTNGQAVTVGQVQPPAQPLQNALQSQQNTINGSSGFTPSSTAPNTLPTNPTNTPPTQPGYQQAGFPAQSVQSSQSAGNALGTQPTFGGGVTNGTPPLTQSGPVPASPIQTLTGSAPSPQESNQPITRVSKSFSSLPNDAGQVWREYDISPYTSRITNVENPQKAIVEWILNETGKEMWFGEPFGILNANRHQLFVYHTPEIQRVVHRIVDRFVQSRGQTQSLAINLVTITSPNWRSNAYVLLQPIDVQTPGVEAWMISKENAALLLGNLRRRVDFKEHAGNKIVYHDGQKVSLANRRPVQFVQSLRWTGNQIPGYQPLMKTIDEGYSLEISGLSSPDGRSIEATLKCGVDQVEKLNDVQVNIPGRQQSSSTQVNLQIPQMVSWRLQERFRWSADQVLLLSCGVVASPNPDSSTSVIPDILRPNRGRSDALMFVEYRGPQQAQATTADPRMGKIPVSPRR